MAPWEHRLERKGAECRKAVDEGRPSARPGRVALAGVAGTVVGAVRAVSVAGHARALFLRRRRAVRGVRILRAARLAGGGADAVRLGLHLSAVSVQAGAGAAAALVAGRAGGAGIGGARLGSAPRIGVR